MSENDSTKVKEQPFETSTYKNIALFGYIGLLVFMPIWLFLLAPSPLSKPLVFVLFILPLLCPFKGIIQGKPYTYAWANFVVLIYFLHSLTTIWVVEGEAVYAAIEFVFASCMFYGGTYYSKYKGKELGLGIKKLKVELAEERARMENNT